MVGMLTITNPQIVREENGTFKHKCKSLGIHDMYLHTVKPLSRTRSHFTVYIHT